LAVGSPCCLEAMETICRVFGMFVL
jgi:hypothetical protein